MLSADRHGILWHPTILQLWMVGCVTIQSKAEF